MEVILQAEMSTSPFGASLEEMYAAVLDQCTWLDGLGVDVARVQFPEGHSSATGGCPSPIGWANAVAGRTKRVQITLTVLAPLYHPVRLAEELAVLDMISRGRVTVIVAAGHQDADCDTFGFDRADRPRMVEEAVDTMKKAWTGEPFEFRGHTVRVSPRPMRGAEMPIYLGGSSKAMARRAARIADGYLGGDEQTSVYREECLRLGKTPGYGTNLAAYPPKVVMITEDPDAGWEVFGEYGFYATNGGRVSKTASGRPIGPAAPQPVASRDALRAAGHFLILTPDECVDLCRRQGHITLQPCIAGFPPSLAQASLDLFAAKVVPHVASARR